METVRVPVDLLTDRLDVRYNAPAAVMARKTIASCGLQSSKVSLLFDDLVCGPFGSTLTADEHSLHGEVLLIQPTNINSDLFSVESSWRITEKTRRNKNLPLYPTESFLFARVGIYPHVGVLPEWIGSSTISSSMIAGIPNGKVDSYYLLAFFRTKYGLPLLFAAQKVTAQPTIGTYEIANTVVPVSKPSAQTYLGDKVRLAEKLRERSRNLETNLKKHFIGLEPQANQQWSRISRVPKTELSDILTASTYKVEFLENFRRIRQKYDEIVPVTSFFKSIRNGFDERSFNGDGIPYLKVGHIAPNYLDFKSTERVNSDCWSEASPEQRPTKGDMLLTRKGTFGVAAIVWSDENFLASSEVFVCKPKEPRLVPLISFFLNSYAGHCQFLQFSTGIVMPGINQENLAKIMVPVLSESVIDDFYQTSKQFKAALDFSSYLTTAAKLLVEALIEGQITENELKTAQEALQRGDREPDQLILSRLTRKGFDVKGEPPLFPDLDTLYQAIDQLNADSEEES